MTTDYEKGYADGMAAALQAAGKTNGVHFEVKLDDSAAVILPTPPLRDYKVTMRRPARQFACEEISAVDARDAVAKMVDASQDWVHVSRWDWDETETDDVDWVHAEACDQGFPDHHDWEAPKPSPGALVKALNMIVDVCNETTREYVVGERLLDIHRIARNALDDLAMSMEAPRE